MAAYPMSFLHNANDDGLRVLITTVPFEKPGGVAMFYRALSKHLGRNVTYFLVGSPLGHEGRIRSIGRLAADTAQFGIALIRTKPDVVHLNPSFGIKALIRDGILLLLAKSLRCKVLVFMHGWDPACELTVLGPLRFLFRAVYFRADAYVVLAEEIRQKLLRLGYDKQIVVGVTAVPDDLFLKPHTSPRTDARPVRVLVLSRIDPGKGVMEAVEAYRIVRETCSDVVLTIAGSGSELPKIREYVASRKIPGVEFLGYVDGLEKDLAFGAADIFLFPTHSEGMPVNVLEAMAYGLPVITRPVGGIGDFFEDGRMGFSTMSGDPRVFASMLKQLVTDRGLRLAMGGYNCAYARRRFAASNVAAFLKQIYATL